MQNIQAITSDNYANKRWLRPGNFTFAKNDAVLALGLGELAQAMSSMPIAFVEKDGVFFLTAIQSFEPGKNYYVREDGAWLCDYLPKTYWYYPFRLAAKNDKEFVLCAIENTGSVVEAEDFPGSFPFYVDDQPSTELKALFDEMLSFEKDNAASRKLCKTLDDMGLLEAWPIEIQKPEGVESLQGFFRINEHKLFALSADELLGLRDCGGLQLCYGQLFSMHNMKKLAKFPTAQLAAVEAVETQAASNLEAFFDDNPTISFDNI